MTLTAARVSRDGASVQTKASNPVVRTREDPIRISQSATTTAITAAPAQDPIAP
jgi:hypothetical protein